MVAVLNFQESTTLGACLVHVPNLIQWLLLPSLSHCVWIVAILVAQSFEIQLW